MRVNGIHISTLSYAGLLALVVGGQSSGLVRLQASTPGVIQSGHIGIAGTLSASGFQLTTNPGAGKVLVSDASGTGSWQSVGGFSLPYVGSASSPGALLDLTNTEQVAPAYAILARTTGTGGGAVLGLMGGQGDSGGTDAPATWGVRGEDANPGGAGVIGLGTNPSGSSLGGYFESPDRGIEVFGGLVGTQSTGELYGVVGVSTATTGLATGGEFQTTSDSGRGVTGYALNPNGSGIGVYGSSGGPFGTGVYGIANATTGPTIGGLFITTSDESKAVVGEATSTIGSTIGVGGRAYSPDGIGVYGFSAGVGVYGGGERVGGEFSGFGSTATGLIVRAPHASGSVLGGKFTVSSPSGTGLLVEHLGSGSGFRSVVTGAGDAVTGTVQGTSGATNAGKFNNLSTDPNSVGVSGFGQSGVRGDGVAYGGLFYSHTGTGVRGRSESSTGSTIGVYGSNEAPGGSGVRGAANATSGSAVGGYFTSTASSGAGIKAEFLGSSSAGDAALFLTPSSFGYGVWSQATHPTGETTGGVFEALSALGIGLFGSGGLYGVYGESGASGTTYGGVFFSDSASGRGAYAEGVLRGVWARATSTTAVNYGLYAETESNVGSGVYGIANGTSSINYGGHFISMGQAGVGVMGIADGTGGTSGVYGKVVSSTGTGTTGYAVSTTGTTVGVYGRTSSSQGIGVKGWASSTSGFTFGVVGDAPSPDGIAVFGYGEIDCTGTKSFRIDHPFNPENQFLVHYCTEAPEPLNAYSGNVTTGSDGKAWVTLPDYFEAINRDFRYQLTIVDDEDFAMVRVSQRIKDKRFQIATSRPNISVSWRVEATRNDLYVQKKGINAEPYKPAEVRGTYLQPELYGLPYERGQSALHQIRERTGLPPEPSEEPKRPQRRTRPKT